MFNRDPRYPELSDKIKDLTDERQSILLAYLMGHYSRDAHFWDTVEEFFKTFQSFTKGQKTPEIKAEKKNISPNKAKRQLSENMTLMEKVSYILDDYCPNRLDSILKV